MNILFNAMIILTIPTTLYVTFLAGAYMFSPRVVVKNEINKELRVAVLIYLKSNSIYLERLLNSLANCYREEDKVEIVLINEEGYETEMKARSFGIEKIVSGSEVGEPLLQKAYEIFNNYDLYITLDVKSVVNKSFLLDIIHGYKKGYKLMQSGSFVKNKVNNMNTFINLLFLIKHGIIANAKERMGVSVGFFQNGYAFSKEILLKISHDNLEKVFTFDTHFEVLHKVARVHYIEEAKVYTDMPISNFRSFKEGENIFCKACYLRQNFFKLLEIIKSGNKLIIIPFLELFLLPIEYYFIFIIASIFTSYKIYGYYSLFLIFFFIVTSIYKFGEKEDLYGITYLPVYILYRVGMLGRRLYKSNLFQ